jgi:RHS repeat-associated protein
MQMGNGKWEHTLFNSRLQVTEIGLGTSSTDASLLKLEYKYGMLVNGVLDPTKNNGNPQSQKITAPKTTSGNLVLTQSYSYDGVNRLQTASEDGTPSWQQAYDCDRYGNRAMRNTSYLPAVNNGLTPLSVNSTDYSAFNQATNRLSVVSNPQVVYDGAGNLTRDQIARLLAYDGENRQVNFNNGAVQYFYDGDGRRVKKIDNTGTTVYVNDAGGKLIGEYRSGSGSGSGTSYVTRDVLGSTRVVTKGNGNVRARYDYLPYGEEIEASKGGRTQVAGYGGADTTRQKFTTYERDNESDLDYAQARYYSSAQGRFISPDEFTGGPVELYFFAAQASSNPTFYANLTNPQSLNKYQYAYNNPLRYVDPDGHDILDAALEFGAGIARGYAASVSYGTYPGSGPNEKDSALSLAGQIIGTAIAFQQGSNLIEGGAVAVPETGPIGGAVAIVGTLEVIGAVHNFGNIAGVLLNKNSNEGNAGEHKGPSQDVEVRPGNPADTPRSPQQVQAADLKVLSKGEIKTLQKAGIDPHDIKPKKSGSQYDLYKDREGNIFVMRKGGKGEPDPTGLNIDDLP